MTKRRCFLPDPEYPGSLQLLTIEQDSHCALFQRCCLESALKKWLALFTIEILEYTLSEGGCLLLAYIPNQSLDHAKALQRTMTFDEKLRKRQGGKGCPRSHNFSAEKLNSLSDFMRIFMRDFLMGHRKHPRPKDLPEGADPYPRQRGRYKPRTVQAEALPPVFSPEQMKNIRHRLVKLGFFSEVATKPVCDLHMSPHGIGSKSFLEKLEARCRAYLQKITGKTIPVPRCPSKNIVPFDPEVWNRRLSELAKMKPYEYYPKTWSFLMASDMMVDSLLRTDTFRFDTSNNPQQKKALLVACLPFTLSIMLSDGLLRWYYKASKRVEFPHYNYYRELKPYEV